MPLDSLAGSDGHTGAAGREAPLTAPDLGWELQTWEFQLLAIR